MQKTKNKTRKRLCAFCGRRDHKNKKCPPPCGVYYCDSVCQQHHWSVHRLTCAYRRHKRDRLNAGACAEDSPVAAASASAGESKTGNDSATDLSTLFFASCTGQTEVVRVLLQTGGIDINQATKFGSTPLFIASQEGHTEVVKLLLQAEGIDVNQATNTGATPLYIASQEGHTEVVKLLNAMSEHGHVADAGESKTVELSPMSAEEAKVIEEALAKMVNGETSLELGRHQIGDVGAIAIADALPQSKLTSIYVHDNEIGDVGASKIAEALPQSELILLYLRGNQIGDVGASKIAEALPQSKLAELFLVDNQIGDAVKQRLEQCKNAEGKSIRMYL